MSTTTTKVETVYDEGNPDDPDGTWTTTWDYFEVEGDLAERIRNRVGKPDGRVVIKQANIPEGYSSYTMWNEIEFTILVDSVEVWHTEQSEAPYGLEATWASGDGERWGESNFALLNDWLEDK